MREDAETQTSGGTKKIFYDYFPKLLKKMKFRNPRRNHERRNHLDPTTQRQKSELSFSKAEIGTIRA